MIVYCEECGFKNIVDQTCVQGENPEIPCCQCREFLHFYGLKAEALKAAMAKQAPQGAAPQPENVSSLPSSLTLKYEEMIVLVDELYPRVSIGRQRQNDIRIFHTQTSRVHAIISLREDGYVLTDQSANGTYVHLEGSEAMIIRKTTLSLTANGVIGLGYKVEFNSPNAIHLLFSSF